MGYRKEIILTLCVVAQLAAIVFIGYKIIEKGRKTGAISIQQLSTENLVFNEGKSSSACYNLQPNKDIIYKANGIWLFEDVVTRVNNDGLIEPRDYEIQKDPGTFRIITLGDSFTAGSRIKQNNWTEFLEDKLNDGALCKSKYKKIEVINLALGGYDIFCEVGRFKQKGLKYKPDLVLWMLLDNDFNQLSQIVFEKENTYKQEMMVSGEYDKLVSQGILFPESQRAAKDMEQIFVNNKNKILKQQIGYLKSIRSSFSNKLVFITFDFMNNDYKDILKSFVAHDSNSYYLDDITDIYKKNASFLPYDSHPNEEGHRIIMSDILKYVVQHKILSCD